MSRLNGNDSPEAVIQKMSDGSTEVARIAYRMIAEGPSIDTYNQAGRLSPVYALDRMGIYGARLWNLFHAECGGSMVKLIALLRAQQLSLVTEAQIIHAADYRAIANELQERWNGVDADDVLRKVQRQLPGFGE